MLQAKRKYTRNKYVDEDNQKQVVYTERMFSAFKFMLRSPAQQMLHTLTWKHQSLFDFSAMSEFVCSLTCLFIIYLFITYLLFLYSFNLFIPYLHFWTWLYYITMFLKGRIQSNQHLALSRLMCGIHRSSTVFPNQVLDRRPAQETSQAAPNCKTKNSKALYSHSV
jgi:hypothetical protein